MIYMFLFFGFGWLTMWLADEGKDITFVLISGVITFMSLIGFVSVT